MKSAAAKFPAPVKSRVTSRGRVSVTAAIERAVRLKSNYKCTHENPETGELCGSRFALETDHIIPVALGGQTTVENLRLVCRTHNQLYAIEKLGHAKMSRDVKALVLNRRFRLPEA